MFPAEILPRKTSFLIRDILPDSVNEDSINRSPHSDSRSPERTPPISRASSLELLHAIRPTAWDARFLTALNHDGDHGVARHSVAQIGRVVHSCGSLCCVVCSSGWTATSLNSDVLSHHSSRVLGGNLGTPPTLVPPSWNCLGSNSIFASSGHDRNREELSESPLSSQLSLSSEINEKPNHRDSTPPSINPNHVPSALNSASSGSSAQTRKVRRNRTVFTELQLMGLERRFDSQKYLSTPDRAELARALGLTQLQVKTWYQNRRMKWKKQVMQGGCTVPPTKPKGRPKKNSIPSMSECELNNLNNPIKPAFLRVVAATGDKPIDFLPTTVPCPFPISDNIV